jgi:hypothetical protein
MLLTIINIYLIDREDFTDNLSDFIKSLEEVPELGFSSDGVVSENSHFVDLRVGVLLSRGGSSDDKVLVDVVSSSVFSSFDHFYI